MAFDTECHEICFVERKTDVINLKSWYLENVLGGGGGGGGGRPFHNYFSITLQFRCTFHFALIQVVMKLSLQNFAHGMIVMLLWHVLNFIALWSPIVLQQNEISIEFELWWKYDKYPKVNGAQVP